MCAEKAAAAGVHAKTRLFEGPTAKAITELARDVDVDWIMVGTHGYTGLKHVLLGRIAERIVRQAPSSVLVVRGVRNWSEAVRPRRCAPAPADLPAGTACVG